MNDRFREMNGAKKDLNLPRTVSFASAEGRRDANDEEARTLLLTIDPLTALAETQLVLHDRVMEVAPTPPELLAAWQAEAEAALAKFAGPNGLGEGSTNRYKVKRLFVRAES